MEVTQAVTIELTEQEALAYSAELAEVMAILQATPDQGNTRTGLHTIWKIGEALTQRGLGFPAPSRGLS